MIRLPAGEVLRQVGSSVKQHEPDKIIELPHIVSWTEAVQEATAAIQGTEGDVFLVRSHTRRQKEILRQTALENVRQDKEASQPSDKKPGLPIRTKYDMSAVPYPEMPSKEVREKLKEQLRKEGLQPPSDRPASHMVTLRAGVQDSLLPTVQSHIRICPIDDEDETSEILPDVNMVWDTGAHRTIISEDLLSEALRRRLKDADNDPFRSEHCSSVQMTAVVALSNSPVTIEMIALVCPRDLMPNSYNGILFGQSGGINSLMYTSIPRSILLQRGEKVDDDVWGDLSLSAHIDMFGDFH